MLVMDVQMGLFPDADRLQPNFRPGSTRMRARLRGGFGYELPMPLHTPLLSLFYEIFPGLQNHSCGETRQDGEDLFVHHPTGEIVTLSRSIDLVHYLEHMILDILFQLGAGDACSGVTGKLKGPVEEFMMYVECVDEQHGRFALNYGMALMHQSIFTGRLDPRYGSALRLACGIGSNTGRSGEEVPEDPFAYRVLASCGLPLSAPVEPEGGPTLVIGRPEALVQVLEDARRRYIAVPSLQTAYEQVATFRFENVLVPEGVDGIASFIEWTLDIQPHMRVIHHASIKMPTLEGKPYRYDIVPYEGQTGSGAPV